MEIEIYANPSQTILNCVRSAAISLCEEVLCKRADRDFFFFKNLAGILCKIGRKSY